MGPVFGGHDPGVCAHCIQAMSLRLAGFFGRAKKSNDDALSLAEILEHPHSLAHALQNAALAHQIAGDHEALEPVAQRAIELAERYNFPPQRSHALLLAGWGRAVGQNSETGLESMEGEKGWKGWKGGKGGKGWTGERARQVPFSRSFL